MAMVVPSVSDRDRRGLDAGRLRSAAKTAARAIGGRRRAPWRSRAPRLVVEDDEVGERAAGVDARRGAPSGSGPGGRETTRDGAASTR